MAKTGLREIMAEAKSLGKTIVEGLLWENGKLVGYCLHYSIKYILEWAYGDNKSLKAGHTLTISRIS